VVFHCAFADDKRLGNLAVTESADDEPRDIALARTQRRLASGLRPSRVRLSAGPGHHASFRPDPLDHRESLSVGHRGLGTVTGLPRDRRKKQQGLRQLGDRVLGSRQRRAGVERSQSVIEPVLVCAQQGSGPKKLRASQFLAALVDKPLELAENRLGVLGAKADKHLGYWPGGKTDQTAPAAQHAKRFT
jgi:hypothetical protein